MPNRVPVIVKSVWLRFLLFVRFIFGQQFSPPLDLEAANDVHISFEVEAALDVDRHKLSSMFSMHLEEEQEEQEEDDREREAENELRFVQFEGPQVAKITESDADKSGVALYPSPIDNAPVLEQLDECLLFVRAMFGQKLSPPVDIEAGHVIYNPALDPIAEEIEKETILLSSMFSKAHEEEEEEDDEAQGSNTPCFVEFPGPQVGKLIEPDIDHRSAVPEEGIYPETLYPLLAAKPPVTEQSEESFEFKSLSNMFSSRFESQEEDDQADNDDDLEREAAPQLIEFQDKFLVKLMHADADKSNGHLYPPIKYPVSDTTPIPDQSTETLDTLRLELRHLFSTSILSEQDEEEAAADDEVDGDILRSSELLKRISACFTKVIAQENQHLAQSCEVHILNAKEDEADSRPLVEMSPKSKVDQNPRHYKEPRVKRSSSIPLSTQLLKLNTAAALADKKTTISKSLAPQESEEAVKAKKKMKPLVPRFFSPQKAQPEEKPPQPTRSWSRPLLKTFRHSGKENKVVHSPVMGSDILPSSKETGKKVRRIGKR